MSENIYIIGDVHGCYKTLRALINKLPNKEKSKICFVGDLIDRGTRSKEVIDFIIENNYDSVLGNHEYFMIKSLPLILEDKKYLHSEKWTLKAGGIETLKSYESISDMKAHLKFLKTLPLYKEYKNFKTNDGRYLVVSHSAVESKWKYKDESKDSKKYKDLKNTVLNSRYKNHDNKKIFNVYGHTPTSEAIIEIHKAQIDLGCCYKDKEPNARLCALEFPSMKVIIQDNIE